MSVPFSSGRSVFTMSALRPKATGFSSKDMFFPPSFMRRVFASSFILFKSVSGDSGISFIFSITVVILGKGA